MTRSSSITLPHSSTVVLPMVVAMTAAVALWWWHLSASTATRQEQQRRQPVAAVDDGDGSNRSKKGPLPITDTTIPQRETTPSTTTGPVREVYLTATTTTEGDPARRGRILRSGNITIVHGSVTGTCAKLAQQLARSIQEQIPPQQQQQYRSVVQWGTIADWDWWDELVNNEDDEEQNPSSSSAYPSSLPNRRLPQPPPVLLVLLPTYTAGSWPPSATTLQVALQDLQHDWRIAKFPLRNTAATTRTLHVSVWGVGSSEYADGTIGQPARECVRQFHKLGAKVLRGVPLRIGDDATANHAIDSFMTWQRDVLQALSKLYHPTEQATASNKANFKKSTCSTTKNECQEDECCQGNATTAAQVADEVVLQDEYNSEEDNDDGDEDDDEKEPELLDLEDMGDAMLASNGSATNTEPPEMVTPSQAKALQKEGYRLIGSHSAVKLCRWTKHQLRGRGGCYKHTFYGITSYQCMETTPSLACANKCVFCWRHHKNPVGKTWRWRTDDPYMIVEQAVEAHVKMIKEAKGIPGVQTDRWMEAHTVRHCALSLVGEPIMYPRINELLGELHRRRISTFLVTNGQHPSAIESLIPVTQLYVSVDAPTQESLIAIDRPLFRDAWDRLRQSLISVRDKGQRTVARLTVVKGWNSDEIAGYAELIALGRVSLVEVKGVTFCGKSDASNLNMTNTPWHHEVVELTQTLRHELNKLRQLHCSDNTNGIDMTTPLEYGLACEHKHSCSVLLARVDQFAVDDPVTGQRRWRTWIDYDRFQELAARSTHDANFSFGVQDYVADTPDWALFGSNEEGFDPTDTRHRKATKYPKYTAFDDRGVPTHDHNQQPLSKQEHERLAALMEERVHEMGGSASAMMEHRDGAREIFDASLMFRGLVIAK